MIQADNPDQIPNPNQPKEAVVSKVPGFSTPVAPHENTTKTDPEKKEAPHWQRTFFHWWHKIALILIVAHGLIGLFESIKFIAIEYPKLSHSLELHIVEISEVNHLLSRAVVTFITTTVNVLFAIRLAKVKESTAHNIDLFIATFLIISTKLIQDLLIQLELVNYVLQYFAK